MEGGVAEPRGDEELSFPNNTRPHAPITPEICCHGKLGRTFNIVSGWGAITEGRDCHSLIVCSLMPVHRSPNDKSIIDDTTRAQKI